MDSNKLWIVLVLTNVLHSVPAYYDCCRYDFCQPPEKKPEEVLRQRPPEITITDPLAKGCICKENPGKDAKCTGSVCYTVPSKLNFTASVFEITTTEINSIVRGDFALYSHLISLKIQNNENLQTIAEYSFENLTNLENLHISHSHKLRYLEPYTFAGLVKLEDVFLTNNGFTSISDISIALTPAVLPVLTSLVATDNTLSSVTSSNFQPMKNSSLKILDILQCRIDYIEPDSLSYLNNLEELHIGYNYMNPENIAQLIRTMMEAKVFIKFLSLYKIGLRTNSPKVLFEAVSNSSVECLNLGENQFNYVDKNTFPPMKNIRMLDFRGANVRDVAKDAFDNVMNLHILLLGANKFTTIPQGATNKNLTYMCIKQNSEFQLSKFFFNIDNFTFSEMQKLETLDVSQNSIRSIYNATFFGLTALKVLSLKKCDLQYVGPGSFSHLNNLIFLDMDQNKFAQGTTHPLETNIFEGLDKLAVLHLGHNNINFINHLTFSSLKSLKRLNLNDNVIVKLDYHYVKYMPRLNLLNMQRNKLVTWNNSLFPYQRNPASFYLGDNRLTKITPAMFDDFKNVTRLVLEENLFECDCDQYNHFKKWRTNNNSEKLISNLNKSGANCYPVGKPIIKFLLEDEINEEMCKKSYLSIIVPCSLFLVFLLSGSLLLYRYRWHWRYYLFLTRLHLIRKGRKRPSKEQTGYSNFEYDAFVSYSNEDSNFVIRLVTMLENNEPFLKLCVYERDFMVGSIISESILESVTKSRKILLIISENYVKSNWCQWETHIAQHCNLYFKDDNGDFADDSLILIKYGNVNEKNLTPTLKYLLKTRIYLQWEKDENKQDIFWKKLKENLLYNRLKESPNRQIE